MNFSLVDSHLGSAKCLFCRAKPLRLLRVSSNALDYVFFCSQCWTELLERKAEGNALLFKVVVDSVLKPQLNLYDMLKDEYFRRKYKGR